MQPGSVQIISRSAVAEINSIGIYWTPQAGCIANKLDRVNDDIGWYRQ